VLESPEDDSLEATSITTRVNSMVLASDGKTYFSPDAGDLYVLDNDDSSLSPVPGTPVNTRFTGGGVSAAGDTFFFATYGEHIGLWYLNNISGTVYPTTLSEVAVGSMFNAPDGNTYFLTSGDGIYKISGAYAPGAILPTNLTSVNFAGEGAGHLTTPGGKTYVWGDGLYRLDAGGLFTSVSSAGGFRAFAVASDGRVYFVNNTGAYRLDPSDDTLTLWWMDNQVRDVAVDAEGNLFFLCIYDIWSYDEVTDGRVTVVASNGYGFNAFAHSPFGELYALPGGAEPDHRLMRLPMIAFLRMPGEWVPVRITPQMVAGGG
jgi:hypothetical protein